MWTCFNYNISQSDNIDVVKQNCESFPVPPIAILTRARIFFLISFKVDMELANYYHVNIILRLKYI